MKPTVEYYKQLVPKDWSANLRFRKLVLEEAGRDRAFQRQLVEICKRDLLFYVNVFCWTYDPRSDGKNLPFITYAFQDDALLKIQTCVIEGRDFAMPKSRDMGASWMGLLVFEWFWHFWANMSFLMISRTEDYVDKRGNPKSLFWKIDHLHANQPKWLLPLGRELGWRDPNRKLLHLRNSETGSVIDGESTTGDAGRGDRRSAMFIDEHAAFDINDGFRVLNATRDTTNCRGFNSTPQGARNAFFEVCHRTNAQVIRLHWSMHPDKARGLYTTDREGKVRIIDNFRGEVWSWTKGKEKPTKVMFPEEYPFQLDSKMRSPWYDEQCARAANQMEIAQELDIDFLGSDYQFFDPKMIDELRRQHCRPPSFIGDIEYDEKGEPQRLRERADGKLQLWLQLDDTGRIPEDMQFVFGVDISAGTGASNSVWSAGDRQTGEKVAVYRDANILPTDFAILVVALCKFFNRGLLVPDRSGPTGEVFVKKVLDLGYGNVYYRRQEERVGRNVTDKPGVYIFGQTRSTLLEDYRDALHKGRFINRSEDGILECLQFIRKSTGDIEHSSSMGARDPSGARTAHGDEVIADALLVLGMSDLLASAISNTERSGIPENCLWTRRQRHADFQRKAAGSRLLSSSWRVG